MKAKNVSLRYMPFFAAYYATNAIYQGYISKFYQALGFDYAQMSLILAMMPAASLLAQPLWGIIGDRVRSRKILLRLLILCAVGASLLYPVSSGFLFILSISGLFAFFYTCIQPMGDSIALDTLNRFHLPFGKVRLAGCWAFALCNLIFVFLTGDQYQLIPYITSGMLLLLLASTFLMPNTDKKQKKPRALPLKLLFKQPHIVSILIFMMLMQLTLGFFYSFFSVHFTLLQGGSIKLLGLCYFISAMSETPFLLNADKLFERFGAGKMLCFSALTMTLRWAVLSLSGNVYVVMLSQLLHGSGFIVITVSTSLYFSRVMPDGLKTSAQMLLALIGYGMARIAGIVGGGFLSSALGSLAPCFGIMACISGLALVIFAPKFLRLAPLNGKE